MAYPRFAVLLLLILTLHALTGVDARYLPTRSQDDRLDRLRELLRDLLENEVDKYAANIPVDPFGPERERERAFVAGYKQRPVPGRVMLSEEDRK